MDHPAPLIAAYVGAQAALAHAVLRAADLVRSEKLNLTRDAVVGRTWRMKGKKRRIPWAAIRHGFTGRDWGGRWIEVLKKVGLPGVDFVIWAVRPDFQGFKREPAEYTDFANMQRVLLQLPPLDGPCLVKRWPVWTWSSLSRSLRKRTGLGRTCSDNPD